MLTQAYLLFKNLFNTKRHYEFYLDATKLTYAPDGWDDDEFMFQRDIKRFGVFRKFTVAELKFVKDGRDYLLAKYEADGVNADCTLTVVENQPSGLIRNRFVGKIDFSTYKRTEISVDVQVIDGSFTDLVLSRAKNDVNLFGQTSIDGAALSPYSNQLITLPEININQVANWEGFDYTTVYPGTHYIFLNLLNSEYSEARSVVAYGFNMFSDAIAEYVDMNFKYKIQATLNGNDSSARFEYKYYITRWVGAVESIIFTDTILGIGVYPLAVDIDLTEVFTINAGDSIGFRAEIVNSVGTGSVQYSNVKVNFTTVIENLPAREINSMLYHEAFERVIEIYTGWAGRFKSDYMGRTDLGYLEDGKTLGAITTGAYIRDLWGLNDTLPASLDSLFTSKQSIACLGMGIELIDGIEKVVIEPMEHFFQPVILLDISDRFHHETLEKEYYPELTFNRINVGYNAFDYRSLGGIYEFNTTSKYTTCIKPVDKQLDIVSPYRADLSGVLTLIKETYDNKDVSGESDIFLLDVIRDGSNFVVRTTEGFDQAEDLSNRDTLINLEITPARNIRRWGAYLRGFLDKYIDSLLVWQTSDKNTKLSSTETGLTTVVENADILVSELTEPLWYPETFKLEVPQREYDIDIINANPYGLIKITDTEYGYILSYRSKNENGKSEFFLLRCNTNYVTPEGTNPVYPATVSIKKTVLDVVVDYTTFNVSLVGDNGFSVIGMAIVHEQVIEITNVPYGNYTVNENATPNYNLVGITPSTFTVDKDNLHFDVVIENERSQGEVTVTKQIVGAGIEYGALYNWYAATDARNILNTGWHIPTKTEFETLRTYLWGSSVAGGKLKESGFEHWDSPNTGADNSSGFNGRGSGYRSSIDGHFDTLKGNCYFWASSESGGLGEKMLLQYNSAGAITVGTHSKKEGFALRGVKDSTDLTDGQTGTYVGNDGKVYRTICIGTQEWIADNLCETKFRTGADISVVTGDAAWSALATEGMCFYDNDADNGFINDDTYFNIVITGQGVGTDSPVEQTGQVRVNEPLVFYDLPFDDYVITEEATEGYTLTSITPDTITIDALNREFDVVIVNEVAEPALELTWDDIANVPVADPYNINEWNLYYSSAFTSVSIIDNTTKLYGYDEMTYFDSSYTSLISIININKFSLLNSLLLTNTLLISPPILSGLIKLDTLDLANTIFTDPPVLTGLVLLKSLGLSGSHIIDPPILTGLTNLENITMNYCPELVSPPNLTGLIDVHQLDLDHNISFDLADIDNVLSQFSTRFASCTAVFLTQSPSIVPTPSTLLTARTVNYQCTFTVNT